MINLKALQAMELKLNYRRIYHIVHGGQMELNWQ